MKYRVNVFLTQKNIYNGEKKKSINGFVIKPVFYEITISDSDKVAYGLHFVF